MQTEQPVNPTNTPPPIAFFRSIRGQIMFWMLLLGLVPLILLGAIATRQAREALRESIQDGQEAIVQNKSELVIQRLERWAAVMNTLVGLPAVVGDTNPVTNIGIADIEQFAFPPSFANAYLEAYTATLRSIRAIAASDPSIEVVFLVATDGEVLLSTQEGLVERGSILIDEDYFVNGLEGFYIGQPYRDVRFNDRLMMDIAHPVERGERLGVAVMRVNLNDLEAIMADTTGLGETGETYLIDAATDEMLTQSRFIEDDTRLSQTYAIRTIAAHNVMEGVPSGREDYRDYRDNPALGAWRGIEFETLNWGTIGEVSQEEAYQELRVWDTVIGLIVVGVAVMIVIVALLVSRTISQPITQMTHTAQRIAAGNLDERVAASGRNEVGTLARAFNSMTEQLRDLIDTLEERVNNRTRDLQVASDVSRQVTTVMDVDELLPQVVELTREGFNLYHVSVYVYIAQTEQLVLAAATGDPGAKMLAEGKFFKLDDAQGLVPRAGRTRNVVMINDVAQSSDYYFNPDLPDAKAELALPMMTASKLIGVLDLQSTQVNRFTEEDMQVLVTLAEQIAVAVRNAQLFAETQQARAAAEQANTIKSQFLANMSHELRTPLNAILNFTEIVADGVLGEVNEKQVDALNKAVASGDHLLSLINDVLDITKIEVGLMELFIEEVDMNAVVRSVLSTSHGLLKNNPRIEFITRIDDDLPTIFGDKRRLRQILLNLVSNAVKFTPEGTVTVTVRNDADAGQIFMSVADTGVGIDPADQEIIFDTFRQTRQGLAQHAGTGLGLPISRHFAQAHGGRLWLESEVGQGATFYVTLPMETGLTDPTQTRPAKRSGSTTESEPESTTEPTTPQ